MNSFPLVTGVIILETCGGMAFWNLEGGEEAMVSGRAPA